MMGFQRHPLLFLVLFLVAHYQPCNAQNSCPGLQVQMPCSCDRSVYEPITIQCDRVQSLEAALQLIGPTGDQKIDRLVISNVQIPILRALSFQNMRITSLTFKNNGMRSIDNRAFEGPLIESLTELSFEGNQLGQIPQAGVSQLKNLRKLNLKNNNINDVPPRAFYNYESRSLLEKLDFSNNLISGLGTISLEGLDAVTEIDFYTNSFSSIPAGGLRALRTTLEYLNLGLNRISDVPVGTLQFGNLKSLSLEFNQIQYISSAALAGIPNLLFLYLGGNKFDKYDPEMFQTVPRLEILGMGSMSIQVIPANAFRYITSLRQLEMTEAAVHTLDPRAFQVIQDSIQVIVLNKNELTRIRQDMFANLTKLESLNLEGNKLTSVDDASWARLGSLNHLDISNNNLKVMESQTFQNTFLQRNLDARTLYLCGNPWVCDERLDWLRAWLRQNPDINIDKPPSCLGQCIEPDWFNRILLREPDPSPLPTPNPQRTPVMSSIGWIILAIILAILLTSICLLALVRYFVGRKRRIVKEQYEDERILASSQVGSYIGASSQSVVGSAYPGSMVDLDLPHAYSLDVQEKVVPIDSRSIYWSSHQR